MPEFDEVKLSRLIIGGEPVGFKKSTGLLHLAGDDLSLEQWQELERRVNLFFHRAGMLEVKRPADSNSGTSSFLTHNLKQILSRESGAIKRPPWWLRWLFDGVITKETL